MINVEKSIGLCPNYGQISQESASASITETTQIADSHNRPTVQARSQQPGQTKAKQQPGRGMLDFVGHRSAQLVTKRDQLIQRLTKGVTTIEGYIVAANPDVQRLITFFVDKLLPDYERVCDELDGLNTPPTPIQQPQTQPNADHYHQYEIEEAQAAANAFLTSCRVRAWQSDQDWQYLAEQAVGLDKAFSSSDSYFFETFARASRLYFSFNPYFDEKTLEGFRHLDGRDYRFAALGLVYDPAQRLVLVASEQAKQATATEGGRY